ncbi:MAG: Nramp family divalent metal transporter [Thermomicrobiales bacterium]|nr:Nramp family divalent metal transporter [Thermomicrobiales bacterium]
MLETTATAANPERRQHAGSADEATRARAAAVLDGAVPRHGLARILPFLGPAFIASIAYMDPGNFATNIQGGAQFGYLLLWVVVASNLMAILIQSLSAKVGIATGKSLPELIRENAPRPVTITLWVIAELVAIATDLAEFLGAAVAFYLLFGIPLLPAGILTGIVTFAILGLERHGFRPLEAVIGVLLGVIAICYVVELFLGRPDLGAAANAILRPRFAGTESVLLASGILGATVMPHVIYLHSALTQHRIVPSGPGQARRIFRFELLDIGLAMSIAGLVNAAMLVMAAATFWAQGYDVTSGDDIITEAYRTLAPLLGGASSTIFAVSLLAAGLSSSAVGTMAGQVIMDGFLHRHIPVLLRRLVTMLPALAVLAIGLDATRTLIISQVALSFGIPFALIPLVLFTRRRDLMGDLTNTWITTAAAAAVTVLIIALNVFLVHQTFIAW